MDRLEAMSVFLRVAELGSFSAASRALALPLPTVSRKVGELEAHLGARLFVRTTRKLALTDAGEGFRAAARRVLEDVEEAERAAAGEYLSPRGELILTAPILFGRLHVLPVVADFLAAFPDIAVRLALSDRNLQVIDEHVDAAVRIGALPDSAFTAVRLGALRTVVCGSPDLIARVGAPETPQDLERLPTVNFNFLSFAPDWRFRLGQAEAAVDIAPRLSVTTAEAAVAAAVDGVGFTRVLGYQCAQAVRDGRLRIVLADFELDPAPVHLIHAQGKRLPLKTRAFFDFAAERLRKRIAAI